MGLQRCDARGDTNLELSGHHYNRTPSPMRLTGNGGSSQQPNEAPVDQNLSFSSAYSWLNSSLAAALCALLDWPIPLIAQCGNMSKPIALYRYRLIRTSPRWRLCWSAAQSHLDVLPQSANRRDRES